MVLNNKQLFKLI